MTDNYKPINCSYHDQLLELATFKKQIEIVFLNHLGEKNNVIGIIKDVYTNSNKEEYLVLDTGLEIRLDRIIMADSYSAGKFPETSC